VTGDLPFAVHRRCPDYISCRGDSLSSLVPLSERRETRAVYSTLLGGRLYGAVVSLSLSLSSLSRLLDLSVYALVSISSLWGRRLSLASLSLLGSVSLCSRLSLVSMGQLSLSLLSLFRLLDLSVYALVSISFLSRLYGVVVSIGSRFKPPPTPTHPAGRPAGDTEFVRLNRPCRTLGAGGRDGGGRAAAAGGEGGRARGEGALSLSPSLSRPLLRPCSGPL
jgi:hypothetical protein